MTLKLRKWTDKIAQRETRKRFQKIDELLHDVALLWGDENESVVGEAEEMRIAMQKFAKSVDENIESLRQERAEACPQ